MLAPALVGNKKWTLEQLRQLVGSADSAGSQRPRRSCSLYPEGLPLRSLVEVSGCGKTQFAVQFIQEQASAPVAWIEDPRRAAQGSINPFGLWQMNLDLQQITFIETMQVEWATQQVLQSQLFPIVICSELLFHEKILRKFQLFVEKYEGLFLLLSSEVHQSWVPALQLQVQRSTHGLSARTLRRRGVG